MATGERLLCVTLLISAVAPYTAPPTAAQTITLDTLSLYDLPGVWVVVDPVGEAAEQDGLHAEGLQRAIEKELRDARIRVFSKTEWQVTIGNPLLYLKLNLVRPSPHLYLYNIELEVRQLVVLARDSTLPAFTTTWEAGDMVGTVPAANLTALEDKALSAVDKFISAHAVANRGRQWWIR